MGLTTELVNTTPNELVFLLINVNEEGDPLGTSAVITADDLINASRQFAYGRAAAPRLRRACAAGDTGLGFVAANAWTQAQARDLLIGNGTVQAGSPLMPRLEVDIQLVNGIGGGSFIAAEVDADVDVNGRPELRITTAAATGVALIRVRLRSSPGVR